MRIELERNQKCTAIIPSENTQCDDSDSNIYVKKRVIIVTKTIVQRRNYSIIKICSFTTYFMNVVYNQPMIRYIFSYLKLEFD